MRIGVVVQTHVIPPVGTMFSLATIFYLGLLKDNPPSLDLVPKLNTVALLMLSPNLAGFGIFFSSYIVPLPKLQLFIVTMDGFKCEPLFGCEREDSRELDMWRMTRRHVRSTAGD
ncbi:hypothetical protein OSB04_007961 [Centaurea solstitialis]|uniref:Uncharacterized protein n=1 Tax=Centaurea solstitialis TaxID=347529 RepID=A0AA38TYM5_9ASTR|nr:hypothetical protein OSB04_007961 [Centaurea solstitialis]